jgi:hypothetical protein
VVLRCGEGGGEGGGGGRGGGLGCLCTAGTNSILVPPPPSPSPHPKFALFFQFPLWQQSGLQLDGSRPAPQPLNRLLMSRPGRLPLVLCHLGGAHIWGSHPGGPLHSCFAVGRPPWSYSRPACRFSVSTRGVGEATRPPPPPPHTHTRTHTHSQTTYHHHLIITSPLRSRARTALPSSPYPFFSAPGIGE